MLVLPPLTNITIHVASLVHMYRIRNKPILPFIIAHLSQVLIMYSCYEACQLFWADFLYDKSVPAGLQFQIFGAVMLWEYFSMIFLRSALGIRYFPRITLLYILMFHCKCDVHVATCLLWLTFPTLIKILTFSFPLSPTQSTSMRLLMVGLLNFW